MGFDSFDAMRAFLPALITDDDEGTSLFIFCYLGCMGYALVTWLRLVLGRPHTVAQIEFCLEEVMSVCFTA
jgi:hypothetical protein